MLCSSTAACVGDFICFLFFDLFFCFCFFFFFFFVLAFENLGYLCLRSSVRLIDMFHKCNCTLTTGS
jgi:hypothetical protein